MSGPGKSLNELLDTILDGKWSAADKAALAELIETQPESQQELIEQLRVHSQLHWHSRDLDNELRFEAEMLAARQEVFRGDALSRRDRRPHYRWFTAAALVCVALSIWHFGIRGRADAKVLAEVFELQGVVWETDSSALRNGTSATRGTLRNSAGQYKLRFNSGPVVEVVGPTSLNIESEELVRLSRGQATAEVPKGAEGFTIATPAIEVVDQGTKFGVSVDDWAATDVIVFDGKVDLQNVPGNREFFQRLGRGEGVQVAAGGEVGRMMQVTCNSQGSWRPLNHPDLSAGVIKRVRDNIPPSGGSLFYSYQITYGGLREDALAYAENIHEWNGLTADGLPQFLLGADYVMTFNDYRYLQDFTMTIELSRPANLYIFADDRIPPPEWLKRQFEDTGVDIGVDEGHWNHSPPEYEHLNVNTTDMGGGKSIDNVFSVWRRKCVDLAPVTLGNAGELKTEGYNGRAMYGIAATPLEISPSP